MERPSKHTAQVLSLTELPPSLSYISSPSVSASMGTQSHEVWPQRKVAEQELSKGLGQGFMIPVPSPCQALELSTHHRLSLAPTLTQSTQTILEPIPVLRVINSFKLQCRRVIIKGHCSSQITFEFPRGLGDLDCKVFLRVGISGTFTFSSTRSFW